MTGRDIQAAATLRWGNWQQSLRIQKLPADRTEAYAIQARLAGVIDPGYYGWKIATASIAGQAHIHVDGPLEGRLLKERVLGSGATVSFNGNLMRVAEAEFAFRMGRDLEAPEKPYSF